MIENFRTIGKLFLSSKSLSGDPLSRLTRADRLSVDLPVLYQLLPDDSPHHLRADAKQLGDGGVGVVEAVQQNLQHLPLLLLHHQPKSERKFAMQSLLV